MNLFSIGSGSMRAGIARVAVAAGVVSLLLCAGGGALAQGPGFPNVARTKGELLAGPVTPTIGRTAVIAYHQGLLIVEPEEPESAAGSDLLSRSYDISDPRNPVPIVIPAMGPNSMVGAHGYWHEGAHLRGLRGSGGRSFTVTGTGAAARVVEDSSLPAYFTARKPGVVMPWAGRGLMFQPFQTQYYRSYNLTEHFNVLFKGTQELAYWDHIGLTGVVGHPFLIGNILYVASDQAMSGIAAYDITPSLANPGTPPQLVGLLTAPIGGYWPEIWGGNGKLLIVFPARAQGRFIVADVTDPTNMFVVADRQLPNGDPSYAQFQDNFLFMDRYKIDMTNDFAVDLALDNRTRGIDVSQFGLPIGNLLVTGGLQRGGQTPMTQGVAIWAHQAAPDTTGPSVGYHIPRADQTSYPVGAPITLLIHETLRTETIVNGSTFLVRPLAQNGTPGAAIAGQIVFAFDDVLTFTPTQPLAPNTTYEVSLPAGGIRDAANNGMIPYSFRFSTGTTLGGGNEPPAILAFTSSAHPAPVGGTITLSFGANDPEGSAVSYRVDFGDGTSSGWITNGSVTHAFAAAGHYGVVLQARDASGATSTQQLTVTVMNAPTGPRPTQSAPVAFDAASGRTWSVNTDNDSVTRVDAGGAVLEIELGEGTRPRSVANDSAGNAWVTCEGTDEIVIVSPAGALVDVIALAYGSAPFGIAFTPDRSSALVSTYGKGELWRFSAATREATGSIVLGPTARAIAITGNGARALVGRHISPDAGGQVWDVALGAGLTLTRTIALAEDIVTPDTASSGRGLPNYLASIAIAPSGARAWVAAKLDNHRRGVFASGSDLTTDGTVRAIVAEIDLASGAEVAGARRDIDNSDSPSGVTFSPLGDWAFVTLQGNNMVVVYDALADAAALGDVPVAARFGTGRAPQGAALDATGQRLHVHDFLSRGITRLELAGFLAGTSGSVTSSFVSTVTSEALPADVIAGKRIFYNASDDGGPDGRNRMSAEGYISCATCHVDGGHDGRTWDFTGRGEGLRNTTDLRGRTGVGHGRVHWSANFDEIQDFENDIRNAFGGAGFLSDSQFAATSDTLGTPKAGRDADLDALAAYVSSLGVRKLPRAPFRAADGTKTEAAVRGGEVFRNYGCTSCHAGGKKTDSALASSVLHDVGTLSTTSGQRLGGPLTGIDTPTLLGVAHSAPYLHDGSAATLEDVFTRAGGTVLQAEDAVLTGASVITATQGGSFHGGEAVRFLSASHRIRFDGVDGGSGGSARVTLRYASLNSNAQVVVRVNGAVAGTLSMPATPNVPSSTPNAWSTRSLDVTLVSGAANTIQLEPNNDRVAIDDVTVVNASDTASAAIHGVVSTLATNLRSDLMQYLRELDGSDAVTLPEVGDTLGAGAAMAGLAMLRRLRKRVRGGA